MPTNTAPTLDDRVDRLERVLGTLVCWLQLADGGLRPDEVQKLLRWLSGEAKIPEKRA